MCRETWLGEGKKRYYSEVLVDYILQALTVIIITVYLAVVAFPSFYPARIRVGGRGRDVRKGLYKLAIIVLLQ